MIWWEVNTSHKFNQLKKALMVSQTTTLRQLRLQSTSNKLKSRWYIRMLSRRLLLLPKKQLISKEGCKRRRRGRLLKQLRRHTGRNWKDLRRSRRRMMPRLEWRKILRSKSMMISFPRLLHKAMLWSQSSSSSKKTNLCSRCHKRKLRPSKRHSRRIKRMPSWMSLSKVKAQTARCIQSHKILVHSQTWPTVWNQPLMTLTPLKT